MARLEDGTVRTKAEPFAPATLLQDVCDLFAVKASQKGLWMGTDIDPNIPTTLIGDNSHLRQVISNLVRLKHGSYPEVTEEENHQTSNQII